MSGVTINKQQVNLYMKTRMSGTSQQLSAAKAGISERSGRRIERGKLQSSKGKRRGRTRLDPLDGVWSKELEPKLSSEPMLTPMTLLELLQKNHPGEYPDKILRTLQRRVKLWKALYGPCKEVMFSQEHPPGLQALSDFTKIKKVNITIDNKQFNHLLYHFRLAFSGWSYMKVICGGESYTALTSGLQEALCRLGGTPLEHRTDHLSAALNNNGKRDIETARKKFTERYQTFCDHYQIKPTYNNLGKCHENGGVEGSNGHLKRRIKQALLLRGSNNFESIKCYQKFIEEVVRNHNRRNAKSIEIERKYLRSLPKYKATDFDEVSVKVSRSSTIDVKRVSYSVPSQLIGERLRLHVYDDKLECYLGSSLVFETIRKYSKDKNHRTRVINYRHIIGSLKKKPQAFRYSKFRNDLLPSSDYTQIWEYVDSHLSANQACKYIVGILSLASENNCEKSLGNLVCMALEKNHTGLPKLKTLRKRFGKDRKTVCVVKVMQHKLDQYDELMPRGKQKQQMEVSHV